MNIDRFQLDKILASAEVGVQHAREILDHVQRDQSIIVSFEDVEYMTPSYTNALVMTLLEHFASLDEILSAMQPKHLKDWQRAALQKSVDRYQRGARLTSQRSHTPPAPAHA